MTEDFGYISAMFRTNTGLVKKATGEIQPQHWLAKPGDASNHLLWVLGHLVMSRLGALKALGSDWSVPWASLFARGARPVSPEECPSVEEIRRAWDEASERLMASVANAPAELLAQPYRQPTFDGKVSGSVAFFAFHETYHVGQLGYLRKWLGYGQVAG
jgi:uncharacterized damage-inducible protein DinB